MAELPGWDRGRLATADEADVRAARWLIFGRALAPAVRRDIDGQIENAEAEIRQGELSKLSGDSHRVAAAREVDRGMKRIREFIGELREAKAMQADVRASLELDGADDEELG